MRYTLAALYALGFIDNVRTFYVARNCVCRTVALTQRTPTALVGVYIVIEKRFTHARRTLLGVNMLHIFVAEVFHCRKYGIGRGLSQRAQRRRFHMVRKVVYFIKVGRFALALGNFRQQI